MVTVIFSTYQSAIDKIIQQLPESDFIKVNLCETDYQPPEWMMNDFVARWKLKHQPTLDDVVVLLGVFSSAFSAIEASSRSDCAKNQKNEIKRNNQNTERQQKDLR